MTMMELNRLTTQYDPMQDRIRLTGELVSGQSVVLWLTQRLLNRLVRHVSQQLEKTSTSKSDVPSVQAHLKQSFAQQRARTVLPRQAPVATEDSSIQWLVKSVGLKANEKANAEGIRLVFTGFADAEQAALSLTATPLRQWLNILHDQYRVAGWATTTWPDWVAESRPLAAADRSAALH